MDMVRAVAPHGSISELRRFSRRAPVDREYSHLSRAPGNERSQKRETGDEFYHPVICPAVNKDDEIAIALVYHPPILLAVTVRWVRKKSGSTRLHGVRAFFYCPLLSVGCTKVRQWGPAGCRR
jgi:hypothetical protein